MQYFDRILKKKINRRVAGSPAVAGCSRSQILGGNIFFVYALYSKSFNKIYIGQTENLERRLFQYNNGLLSGYTKKFKPWEVIYTEEYQTRQEVLIREKQLKSQKGREFIWKIVKDKGLQVRSVS